MKVVDFLLGPTIRGSQLKNGTASDLGGPERTTPRPSLEGNAVNGRCTLNYTYGIRPVGPAREVVENRFRPAVAAWNQLEYGSITACSTLHGCAIEIAGLIPDERTCRINAVASICEGVEDTLLPNTV